MIGDYIALLLHGSDGRNNDNRNRRPASAQHRVYHGLASGSTLVHCRQVISVKYLLQRSPFLRKGFGFAIGCSWVAVKCALDVILNSKLGYRDAQHRPAREEEQRPDCSNRPDRRPCACLPA